MQHDRVVESVGGETWTGQLYTRMAEKQGPRLGNRNEASHMHGFSRGLAFLFPIPLRLSDLRSRCNLGFHCACLRSPLAARNSSECVSADLFARHECHVNVHHWKLDVSLSWEVEQSFSFPPCTRGAVVDLLGATRASNGGLNSTCACCRHHGVQPQRELRLQADHRAQHGPVRPQGCRLLHPGEDRHRRRDQAQLRRLLR